ncbi:MAG: ECF transporter S component [Clostridia bacterium]|nr:ECF transporter S component [Clostridia bacterium]
MHQKRLQCVVFSAMFCALVFAATMIAVPTGLVGNVNLGDGVLLLCAWMLGGPWAVASAALGAALADLAAGYAIYAPATLVIKALMVVAVLFVCRAMEGLRLSARLSRVLSAICAELIMLVGYFLYEAFVLQYGLAATANIPFNAVQGALGIVLSLVLYEVLERAGIGVHRE